MGLPSLRESIEEIAHLNSLVASGLSALARSKAAADEIERREQIVAGLIKRCRWIEATIADVRKSASEIDPDIGSHAFSLRTRLEQANERIDELTAEMTVLRVRLKVRPKKSAREKRLNKKKRGAAKRVAAKPAKREPVPDPTIDEKIRSRSFESRVVGTISQQFSHKRSKRVVVEKIVRRGQTKKLNARTK